ncbi:hypothetical protein EJB05_56597, partial [Eragrostis curvula]
LNRANRVVFSKLGEPELRRLAVKSFRSVTETTPEPLDFQLPEEQTQEVQEEQPPQDTDPADPVSYAPEPSKPRDMHTVLLDKYLNLKIKLENKDQVAPLSPTLWVEVGSGMASFPLVGPPTGRLRSDLLPSPHLHGFGCGFFLYPLYRLDPAKSGDASLGTAGQGSQ